MYFSDIEIQQCIQDIENSWRNERKRAVFIMFLPFPCKSSGFCNIVLCALFYVHTYIMHVLYTPHYKHTYTTVCTPKNSTLNKGGLRPQKDKKVKKSLN